MFRLLLTFYNNTDPSRWNSCDCFGRIDKLIKMIMFYFLDVLFFFNQFTISDNMFAPLTLNDLRLSYKNINGGEGILLKVCLTNYDCLIFLILKNWFLILIDSSSQINAIDTFANLTCHLIHYLFFFSLNNSSVTIETLKTNILRN